MELREIALFPIPEMVCFPQTTVALHVFEPRYRKLIKEAAKEGRWVGVCHTQKILSPAPPEQDPMAALQSNQATYEPEKIFSAGPVLIDDVSADGRLMVRVLMQDRFQIQRSLQDLPYRVVLAEKLDDQADLPQNEAIQLLRASIEQKLRTQLQELEAPPATQQHLQRLGDLDNAAFSYQVFQILRPEGRVAQKILEMRNGNARIIGIAHILGITDKNSFS